MLRKWIIKKGYKGSAKGADSETMRRVQRGLWVGIRKVSRTNARDKKPKDVHNLQSVVRRDGVQMFLERMM